MLLTWFSFNKCSKAGIGFVNKLSPVPKLSLDTNVEVVNIFCASISQNLGLDI